MKGVITIFAMPQELEDLAYLLHNLKINSVFLSGDVDYKIDLTMCLSDELTDWNKTKLPKEYFDERTKELCSIYLDWCEYDLVIEKGNRILGCDSKRRESWLNNPDADFFIWLDADILFKESTLFYMETAYKIIKEQNLDMFVITPQFVKQWDHTWDPIVNQKHLYKGFDYHLKNDAFKDIYPQEEDIKATKINTFKFAGGWFTLISKALMDKVGVPESIGHYGIADTLIVACCQIMAQKNIPVAQYVIENLLCSENHRYRTNKTIKSFISSKDRKDEFRNISHANFDNEVRKFYTSLP